MKRAWIVCLLLVTACAPLRPETAAKPLEPGIYRVSTGERLEPEALYQALSAHRFVVVGETHTDPWHHEVQLLVYQGVSARRQGPTALGMEMFQRPYQAPLDAYIKGEIEEAAMLEGTEYMKRWRFDPKMYAPLWEHARAKRAPLVALNARKEITRKVAKVGVQGLSEEEREGLPELDLTNTAHKTWMRDIFKAHGGHKMDDAMFDRFYQAQVIWDETMADTAWRFVQGGGAEAMVILAGTGHVQRSFGIPGRLRRRAGDPQAVVTLIPVSGSGPHGAGAVTTATFKTWTEQAYADYVWVRK